MDIRYEVDPEMGRLLNLFGNATQATQEAALSEAESEIDKTWVSALTAHAGTELEQRMIVDGARADMLGPSSFELVAGIGGPVSGGLGTGSDDWAAAEFGMDPKQIDAPTRRKTMILNGRPFRARTTIWVGKNLKPRNPDGYVAMPTIRERGPRYVAAMIRGLINVLRGGPVEIQKD